jgi:membrane-associated phospholipid phosphatase
MPHFRALSTAPHGPSLPRRAKAPLAGRAILAGPQVGVLAPTQCPPEITLRPRRARLSPPSRLALHGHGSTALAALVVALGPGLARAAAGDDEEKAAAPSPAASAPSSASPAPEVTPPPRQVKPGVIIPQPKPEETPPTRIRFVAEPVSDGAILSLSIGVGAISGAVLGTGEIVPQQPQSVDRLLRIDRGAVTTTPSRTWDRVSDLGPISAFGFAAIDSVLSRFRHGPDAGVADAFIYAESIAVTWGMTNLAKIAFRRPRPSAYREQQQLYDQYGKEAAPDITDTNSALSFYSGHTAFTATVGATATYLAFARAPHSPRPWITLGVSAAMTTLTAVGRVRSGEHFPTDVIAGAMVGAGIGILVPHLHRSDDTKQRPVWIGAAPGPGGGSVSAGGVFLTRRAAESTAPPPAASA